MKDAIGSTMLIYIFIIIVGIVGSVLIASNMYTNAYKAKNNIIRSIDRYYQVRDDSNDECFDDTDCINSISRTLKDMGYYIKNDSLCYSKKILNKVGKIAAEDGSVPDLVYPKPDDDFNGYCVFKNTLSDTDYYYTVVTFSHLNVPVFGFGSLFLTPVYGETRIFYKG